MFTNGNLEIKLQKLPKTIKTKLKLFVFRSQSPAVKVLVRYRQLIYKCQ